jgi:hypothetical protein
VVFNTGRSQIPPGSSYGGTVKAAQLKEALAKTMLENRLLKKAATGWGRRYMRYTAAKKCEIIDLIANSSLPVPVNSLALSGSGNAALSEYFALPDNSISFVLVLNAAPFD